MVSETRIAREVLAANGITENVTYIVWAPNVETEIVRSSGICRLPIQLKIGSV